MTKPGKLFNLKEWLSIEDAAKHLTLLFDEAVSAPDILRLALDGHLRISAFFVNGAAVRKGRLVSLSECRWYVFRNPAARGKSLPLPEKRKITKQELDEIFPALEPHIEAGDVTVMPDALQFSSDDQWLVLEDRVTHISGVWDLCLVGGERHDVEHRFQMETEGPPVTLTSLDGAFVTRDGIVCQLQEDFEENEHQPGSKANGERLEEYLFTEQVCKDETKRLREEYAEKRKAYLEKRRNQKPYLNYFPSGGLPTDSLLVVRTDALRDLEQTLSGATREGATMNKREEISFLNIIGGLLGLLLGETPSGRRQSVFRNQAAVIEALLAHYGGKQGITKRTLEKKLAAAKRHLADDA